MGKKYAATYRSYPNSLADLKLELKENLRFEYYMIILPEPETDGQIDTLFFKGKWKTEYQNYVLRFQRRKRPDLHALLDSEYNPKTSIMILDSRHISFPLNAKEISIWGVLCYRMEE